MDFAGKTDNYILSIQGKFYNLIIRCLSSAIRFSTYRQLDVFDGAGSGDGIDGRLSTTSEKMLVITIKLESIISTY